MNKKTIDDLQLKGKKVLIRVDFNVPLKDGKITSNKRIVAAIPTIKKVVDEGGRVILLSHLGRIKSEADLNNKSLFPIAEELSCEINIPLKFVDGTHGPKLTEAVNTLKDGEILLCENTRFEDLNNNSESKNNKELAQYWASLADIFINDAFGTAHRAHASNVGIATYVKESAVGYLVEKEIKMLSQGLDNPEKPFIAIIGGAKVSDKISVIENLLTKADKILIGGGMSYTFLKAQGHTIGTSLVEEDKIELAKSFLEKGKDKIVLPLDFAIASSFKDEPRKETEGVDIPENMMGLDIGAKTIAKYKELLKGAKTVVWNGPMGVAEFNNFKLGTESVAKAIAEQPGVFSIIGGGDSAAAAIDLGFEDKFTHISTGGGASLTFMEGKPLPGIEAIQNKQ
ncbi:MAG: phosphoglycerate kinase [Mycoplasma sp.]|nr:phosphoglycerate kinase [Mycoplasma sp.]